VRAWLSSGHLKTADQCNQKPPANPVVFAVSIFCWITGVHGRASLFGLPPGRTEIPERQFLVWRPFGNHFESFASDNCGKRIERRGQKDFFPATMPMPQNPGKFFIGKFQPGHFNSE
jgi:hypothetical protein